MKITNYSCNTVSIQHFCRKHKLLILPLYLLALHAPTTHASQAAKTLMDLSLEELATLPITSVSKSAKPISEAPASIFVITSQDIHSAGSASLPESLRLAPNLQVAQLDARNYAITARGFNNAFANKLLVLVDGRTIYSPLFSGVFWDAQDLVLEDLDRIEVISGAGGTLWGANAVNGVVNIVTRSAEKTQGALASVSGSEFEKYATTRYGGSFSNDGYYRVYAKQSTHDDTFTTTGASTKTGWSRAQAGFRIDWSDNLTVQGDAYSGKLHQAGTQDIEISGANILGHRDWQLSPDSKLSFQAYIDYTSRDQANAFFERITTYDLELQHDWTSGSHNLVWGVGYRSIADRINNDVVFSFLPGNLDMTWKNIFVRDEIALTDTVKLTLGNKWESNPFTDWESMPDARLAWSPSDTQLVWSSLSHAVRSPSRIDRDLYSPSNPAEVNGVPQYFLAGGPDFTSEEINVFELGYRGQLSPDVTFSITGFYSEYDQLRTFEFNTKGPGFVFLNNAEGSSYGVELWSSWQVTSDWRLHFGLVTQEFDVELKPGTLDLSNATGLASVDPNYSGSIRSSYQISNNLELDATLRYVDRLKLTNVPSYTALDLKIGWAITPQLEFSLVGQNILDPSHAEFGTAQGRSEIERAFFAKLTWTL